MGTPVEINPLQLGAGGYTIGRSVRLRSSATAYLNRIFATGSGETTGTFSVWIKRGKLGAQQNIFLVGNSATTYAGLYFDAGDTLSFARFNTTAQAQLTTTQVFRDPSAWYHVIVAWDSTQATASNRIKMYVNGVQITSFTTATYPTQNLDMYLLNGDGTTPHEIGYYPTSGNYFDGYLAEIYAVKGQALTPSSFGYTDSNGIWQPLPYAGTYGTNGFYLKFADNSAATAAAIGKDYSGNGNNWTPNNISVTAGVTYDSMIDSPTVGYAASNYAVLNPISKSANATLTDGNLTGAWSGATQTQQNTFGMPSGKWYWESTITASSLSPCTCGIGINSSAVPTSGAYPGGDATSWGYYGNLGVIRNNGTNLQSGLATFTTNDVIGVAYDAGAGSLTFYKNNVQVGTTVTGIPITTYFASYGNGSAGNTFTVATNFGQRPFAYTPPTGFVALNTYNLPAATINNGATVMAASTYTGTGATLSVANSGNNPAAVSFTPDLVWIKSRSAATDHKLTDSVRGATKALISDTTGAETTDTTGLTAFGSNGFTLGTSSVYNTNAATYVGWQWQAGQGTTSSNTNGSITSTVSVNQSAGFSIVTYTGTGSAATVGHGLGVAPKMMVVKQRSGPNDWPVYHASIGNTGSVFLDLTNATATSALYWNNTSPTSSVFTVGSGTGVNGNGSTYVAYCWSEVAGYSKFGSYTGNGSTDGPFVYCGFRPRWLMIKRTDAIENWYLYDTSRNTYNQITTGLFPNLSNAESSINGYVDVLSNGFKLRANSTENNASGGTYIYAAFAENPFNISRAR